MEKLNVTNVKISFSDREDVKKHDLYAHVPQKGADSTKDNFLSNEFLPPHVLCNNFFHSTRLISIFEIE